MVSALYRRYRPEAFSELVGQQHVTEPLMTALRTDRVNHAYLFSGPRGCGKTTSARILARCLNCEQGPTDSPCGTCPSCVELGRDGGGSIDVIEIDAASHGGVDDARDLRERATIGTARDRYKIYIIDEAHMVSKDGFNALLKIVEEPPEHVKFIFATTEPEKVIGTIRSRTHHYPFRLIAPNVLLEYVTQIINEEGVSIDPGVLPLVIRAGGGSARDTLSLLDQLIAGSSGAVTYELAVSLLGFTHTELLDRVAHAIAAADASAAFDAVEQVIETGQDPRRFVEDLLEYLRDLLIAVMSDNAEVLLQGVQEEQVERMRDLAHEFGPARLSQAADTVAKSLTGMTGATSPKLHLELMLARLLVGTAKVEAAPQQSARPAAAKSNEVPTAAAPSKQEAAQTQARQQAQAESTEPASAKDPSAEASYARAEPAQQERAQPEPEPEVVRPNTEAATASFRVASVTAPPAEESAGHEPATVTFEQISDAWPEVLGKVEAISRRAWMVASAMKPVDFDGNKVGMTFRSPADLEQFRSGKDGQDLIWKIILAAMEQRFGRSFGFAPREGGFVSDGVPGSQPGQEPEPTPPPEPEDEPPYEPEPPQEQTPTRAAEEPAGRDAPANQPTASASSGWAVAQIPTADDVPVESPYSTADPWAEPADAGPTAAPARQQSPQPDPEPELTADERNRYGEAVIREELGAEFIEEITNDGGR